MPVILAMFSDLKPNPNFIPQLWMVCHVLTHISQLISHSLHYSKLTCVHWSCAVPHCSVVASHQARVISYSHMSLCAHARRWASRSRADFQADLTAELQWGQWWGRPHFPNQPCPHPKPQHASSAGWFRPNGDAPRHAGMGFLRCVAWRMP